MDREATLALREDIKNDRAAKGLSPDLNEVVRQAYLVSKEYGDIWKQYLIDPIPTDE